MFQRTVLGLMCAYALAASVTELRVIVVGQDGRPIPNTQIELPSENRFARTDSTGEAHFAGVAEGPQRIIARHIGYASVDAVVQVTGEIAKVTIELESRAPTLDTVRVSDHTRSPRLQDFDRRRGMGIGRFVDSSAFKGANGRPVTTILVTRFPGLKLVPVVGPGQCPGINCRRDLPGTGALRLEATQSDGLMYDQAATCPIDVYFDGAFFTEDIEAIDASTIAGAELYDRGSAPPEYRRLGKACKVLLLWTKERS